MKIGYARVSTDDQSLQVQLEQLKEVGCGRFYHESESGKRTDRPQLELCLECLREGDALVITRLDRLARSMMDLLNIVQRITDKGATLKVTEQSVDTSTPEGRAMLGMLGVFAEFETDLRKERQTEGIAQARAAGKYTGRQPTARAKSKQVIELTKQGYTRQAVADELGISIASVYRILADEKRKTLNKHLTRD